MDSTVVKGGCVSLCVDVCVIALLLDLERPLKVVRSLITPLEEFMRRSEWTFLCVVV